MRFARTALSALLLIAMLLASAAGAGAWADDVQAAAVGSHMVNANKAKPSKPARRAPQPPAKAAWDLPMTLTLVRSSAPGCEPLCPEWLSAEGEITAETPVTFRKALLQTGKRWLPVVIRSPGGDTKAAMEVGRMLRKAGLPVGVGLTIYEGCSPHDKSCKPQQTGEPYRGFAMVGEGFCFAACPLILAGGTERYAGGGTVGLHDMPRQWIRDLVVSGEAAYGRLPPFSVKEELDKTMRAELAAYLDEMGISPAYLDERDKPVNANLRRFTPPPLRELKLITSYSTVLDILSPAVCKDNPPSGNCRFVVADKPVAGIPAPPVVLPKPAEQAPPNAEWDHPLTASLVRSSEPGCEPHCAEWLALDGEIMATSDVTVRRALAQLGGRWVPVVIRSVGGDVDAATNIGSMINGLGLPVIVGRTIYAGCKPGDVTCTPTTYRGRMLATGQFCRSACTLVLAGGAQRYADRSSDIAVHVIRHSRTEEQLTYHDVLKMVDGQLKRVRDVASRQTVTRFSDEINEEDRRFLSSYLSRMGVKIALIDDMMKGSHDDLYRPPPDRLRELGLLTSLGEFPTLSQPIIRGAGAPTASRVRVPGACEPNCPEWIAIDGAITATTLRRVRDLLGALDGRKLPVFLNSTGGDLSAAIDIGTLIREHGLVTAVGKTQFAGCDPDAPCSRYLPLRIPLHGRIAGYGDCERECLFVLAGGVERWDGLAGATLALSPDSLRTSSSVAAAPDQVRSYLRRMSVSLDLLNPQRSGTHLRPRWLSAQDRQDLGLGTTRASPAAIADMGPCNGPQAIAGCVYRGPGPRLSLQAPAIVTRLRGVGDCEPRCPEWIMIRGTITRDTPRRLASVLESFDEGRPPIMLDSPGGDFDAAIELGHMIRATTFTTVVGQNLLLDCDPVDGDCSTGRDPGDPYRAQPVPGGRCDAACLFVLAAGTNRYIGRQFSPALPSMSSITTRRTDASPAEIITRYFDEMSLSPSLAEFLIRMTGRDPIMLSPQQVMDYRLGNRFANPSGFALPGRCKSKATDMNCFLRVPDNS